MNINDLKRVAQGTKESRADEIVHMTRAELKEIVEQLETATSSTSALIRAADDLVSLAVGTSPSDSLVLLTAAAQAYYTTRYPREALFGAPVKLLAALDQLRADYS